MAHKPVIFISSTSNLRSARDLVGKVLYAMGYEPVWQDIEATDGGELLELLRRRLAPCSMVVQLVGQRYGAEPPQPTREFGRVSYTQFEALEAERLGKKVIYHFLDDNFPGDLVSPEPQDLQLLQQAYRERLKETNHLRQIGIATPTDLELSIRRINDELAVLRRQAERRQRNLVLLAATTAIGIAAVAGLVFLLMHRQAKTETSIVESGAETRLELEQIRSQINEALAPKALPAGQSQPSPLAPELVAKAKFLMDRGNAEDQALAKIALNQHAEADRIIQGLKSNPDNPIDESFRLLTMEGDNWYQAGDPDKAIGPYEQAMALKPEDLEARHNVTLVHGFARLGDIADHRRRAIEVAEKTLTLLPTGSQRWARTENDLGIAWGDLEEGNQSDNIKKAIAAYNAALTVFKPESDPLDWAMTQNNLGKAWGDLPTGNRSANFSMAISCYEKAVTVYTKGKFPADWAMAQNNIGVAWFGMPSGNESENLKKAISAYNNALTVYTKEQFPSDWANTEKNLGAAWENLQTGDRSKNLKNAVAACRAALTVYSKDQFPADWATTENNLGNCLDKIVTGNRNENVRNAIAAYQDALTVRTKDRFPAEWAKTHTNLGQALTDLPTGDKGANYAKAIQAYEAALTVFTKDQFPSDWAWTQNHLGVAWYYLPTGDSDANDQKAIAAYTAAMQVWTKDAYPEEWANLQNNLGGAFTDLSSGDRSENFRKGIACYEAALSVYTREGAPEQWAMTQNNLGKAWARMPGGDRNENLQHAAAAFQAALTVYTPDAFPDQWASVQRNLTAARANAH